MSLLDLSGVLETLSSSLLSSTGLTVLFSLAYELLLLLLLLDLPKKVLRDQVIKVHHLPFFASGLPPLILLTVRIAIRYPFITEGVVPRPVSISLLVYFSVLLNTEPRLVSQLIPDALPPLHLLDPLLEVGVVRVDVVMGLCLVVSSDKQEFYKLKAVKLKKKV